jgi:hypothetical protein
MTVRVLLVTKNEMDTSVVLLPKNSITFIYDLLDEPHHSALKPPLSEIEMVHSSKVRSRQSPILENGGSEKLKFLWRTRD